MVLSAKLVANLVHQAAAEHRPALGRSPKQTGGSSSKKTRPQIESSKKIPASVCRLKLISSPLYLSQIIWSIVWAYKSFWERFSCSYHKLQSAFLELLMHSANSLKEVFFNWVTLSNFNKVVPSLERSRTVQLFDVRICESSTAQPFLSPNIFHKKFLVFRINYFKFAISNQFVVNSRNLKSSELQSLERREFP